MELVARKNDLLRELQLFQGIVERKNTIPILANALMTAEHDEVRFLATDLEVGLRSKCAASVAKSGSLTLPAEKFYASIKSLAATQPRKAQGTITGEDTRYFLNGAQFVLRPDSMTLVATDGHRLALVSVPRDGKGKKD